MSDQDGESALGPVGHIPRSNIAILLVVLCVPSLFGCLAVVIMCVTRHISPHMAHEIDDTDEEMSVDHDHGGHGEDNGANGAESYELDELTPSGRRRRSNPAGDEESAFGADWPLRSDAPGSSAGHGARVSGPRPLSLLDPAAFQMPSSPFRDIHAEIRAEQERLRQRKAEHRVTQWPGSVVSIISTESPSTGTPRRVATGPYGPVPSPHRLANSSNSGAHMYGMSPAASFLSSTGEACRMPFMNSSDRGSIRSDRRPLLPMPELDVEDKKKGKGKEKEKENEDAASRASTEWQTEYDE